VSSSAAEDSLLDVAAATVQLLAVELPEIMAITGAGMLDGLAVVLAEAHVFDGLLERNARIATAEGDIERAEHDALDALSRYAGVEAYLGVPDSLEILAGITADVGGHREAARPFGAANGIRRRTGEVRLPIYAAGYEEAVDASRNAMGEKDFDAAWAEGVALSTEEAMAYAQRGRGRRK
jgi:hypothetical protein